MNLLRLVVSRSLPFLAFDLLVTLLMLILICCGVLFTAALLPYASCVLMSFRLKTVSLCLPHPAVCPSLASAISVG